MGRANIGMRACYSPFGVHELGFVKKDAFGGVNRKRGVLWCDAFCDTFDEHGVTFFCSVEKGVVTFIWFMKPAGFYECVPFVVFLVVHEDGLALVGRSVWVEGFEKGGFCTIDSECLVG